MKTPNTKLQTPDKLQIQSSKTLIRERRLDAGAWDFSGAWCLGFGISVKHAINQPSALMKLTLTLLFAGSLAVCAETEEQINKRFAVQPGGKLVVDVDFGSIDVSTNASGEVIVD